MKNRIMRQMGVLIVAGTLALGMAGCAGTTGTTATATNAATETDASTEAATGDAAADADTESTEGATEDAAESGIEADTEAAATDDAVGDTAAEGTAGELTGARKRRTLPHKETVAAAESTESKVNPNAVAEEYPTSTDEIVRLDSYKGDTVSFKEVKAVKETAVTKEDDSYPESQEIMEQMLSGLMTYWADSNMESVDYLVRMGKYRYLSQMLNGSEDYFYVGEENADGEPNGTGLAVYANNAYYYGGFENGERSGNGFWYQIFVKDGAYSKANNGIIGHSYNGEWANDLPNGEGQEHLDIDVAYLKDRVITNVKTTFVDGYYNGEIVATSLETSEGMINWTGEARYGKMVVIDGEFVENKSGEQEIRVLENVDDENNYYWMLLGENCGQGITGLIG